MQAIELASFLLKGINGGKKKMMNYELFKEVVMEKFMDYMSDEFQNCKLKMTQVEKVNQVKDGINLTTTDSDNKLGVMPTIYLNDMYEHYKESEDLNGTIAKAAEDMERVIKENPFKKESLDFDSARENIVFQLINTEQNKELLKNVPNRQFQDLSIIYRWVVNVDEAGIASSVIRDNFAEHLGLSEEELFKLAVENTRRLFPPTVKSMNDVIAEMFVKDGMPAEIAEMMINEMPKEQMLWVISNDRQLNGAISMLYEDKLQELAQELDADLYIMPSSIHETIAVSAEFGDPYQLAEMVTEINMDQVSLDERLSNQVYHYDKDLRKLTLATDTPNKRLDGVVAEPEMIYSEKSR